MVMADARQEAEYARTAMILAMMANVNRDPKRNPKAFQPSDFMPRKGVEKHHPKGGIDALKVFVKGSKRGHPAANLGTHNRNHAGRVGGLGPAEMGPSP